MKTLIMSLILASILNIHAVSFASDLDTTTVAPPEPPVVDIKDGNEG